MKFTFPPESKPLEGFTIKRAIQRGGFGEVYYALSDAGKEVALKLLQQNRHVELRGVRQCLNLKHPNLVTIFDIRTDGDGDNWIVMEYVSGQGLDQVLTDYPDGMPIEKVGEWLSGIVAGLSYLHDRGIVHRDLKPANVYREHAQVKIGDVGLSKFISESHRGAQTQSVGTVYYMAPEVAHGRYGREIDVYSLGIILYEMLTGRVPFDGETAGEILMKHLSEKPDLTAVPKRLRPVVAHALEKDPLLRTASVAQLEAEFKKALLGLKIPRDIPEESFVTGSTKPTGQAPHHVADGQATGNEARHSAGRTHSGPRPAGHRFGRGVHPAQQRRRRGDEQRRQWMWMVAIILLILALVSPGTLFAMTGKLFVLGMVGALGYGVFRLVQLFAGLPSESFVGDGFSSSAAAETRVYQGDESPTPVSPSTTTPPPKRPVPRRPAPVAGRRFRTSSLTPETLRTIPFRQRAMELSGSLTFAVFSTAVITAGLAFLEFLPDPATIGLFGLTTLLAAWALLAISKFWEGTPIDATLRRLTLLLVGAAVGAGAFWLDHALMVDLSKSGSGQPYGLIASVGSRQLIENLEPTMFGYMVFFAGLFALRRWWWHADSFRPRQYRVTSALWTAMLGYFLTALFTFPHSWGILWAVAISSVVQLSAVWVPPERRAQLMEARSHEPD